MSDYLIIGNVIKFRSGETLSFPMRISISAIIQKRIIVVLLNIDQGQWNNENVYGIDLERQSVAWRIKNNKGDMSFNFMDFATHDPTKLILFNNSRLNFVINPITGEIVEEFWEVGK